MFEFPAQKVREIFGNLTEDERLLASPILARLEEYIREPATLSRNLQSQWLEIRGRFTEALNLPNMKNLKPALLQYLTVNSAEALKDPMLKFVYYANDVVHSGDSSSKDESLKFYLCGFDGCYEIGKYRCACGCYAYLCSIHSSCCDHCEFPSYHCNDHKPENDCAVGHGNLCNNCITEAEECSGNCGSYFCRQSMSEGLDMYDDIHCCDNHTKYCSGCSAGIEEDHEC